ncbi:MAG TPA: hypothetical protein VFW80_06460 [Gaiellaceae bacterium]|nr:hypothetical protein [Gaiellaceae bacterium]
MADWATISSLATAGGTLVLAAATFAAVRSSNRAARAAEESLLVGLRPLLVPSRPNDPPQRINYADGKRVQVDGAAGVAEATDEAVYFAISIRNVGSGIAVLHGWHFYAESALRREHAALDDFKRLTVDLYIPPGDIGYWQGTFRDPSSPEFASAKGAIDARAWLMVELLYGDYEGGQRVVSRFALIPKDDGGLLATVSRHWNIDRSAPR